MWRIAREIFEVLQKELGHARKVSMKLVSMLFKKSYQDIDTLIGLANSIKVKKSKIKPYSNERNDYLDEKKSGRNNYQRK